MKGVVIAGGLGTRLQPLTDPLTKEMLPVYNKPMIVHAVETLINGGITDIAFITNVTVVDVYRRMLEKADLPCTIAYFTEESRSGPGRALLLVEEWIGKHEFARILGDSLFFTKLPRLSSKKAPRLFVMEMAETENDLNKYGQVKISGRKIKEMMWKPDEVSSNIIQTTVFLFPPDIFDRIRAFGESQEIHISDLTAQYVSEGLMKYTLLPQGSYLDCGTIDALFQASVKMRALVRGD